MNLWFFFSAMTAHPFVIGRLVLNPLICTCIATMLEERFCRREGCRMGVPQFRQFFRVTVDFQAAVAPHSGQPITFCVMVDADPVMLTSGRLCRSWLRRLGFRCLCWLRFRRCGFRWSRCRFCGYFQNRSACLLGLRRRRYIFLPGNRCLRNFCWNWKHRCGGSFRSRNCIGRCVGVCLGSRSEGPICVDCWLRAFGFLLRIEKLCRRKWREFL